MKTRETQIDMSISVRMNKAEWEKTKLDGDTLFNNRSVGYMNVLPGKIQFETTSPYYKDLRELDEQDKEKTDDQVSKDKEVDKAIKAKKVQ